MKLYQAGLLAACVCASVAVAADNGAPSGAVAGQQIGSSNPANPVEEILVKGVRERLYANGALKDVIQKTEVIGEELIISRQAVNLSQAIEQSPGVRVSNECSMCGVKRIMLNGLRGEHTTILTDGIPLHTMMAGFYAVDALPTTGVQRIEVARGAGASLIAPEAVGGTINVISSVPTETALEVNLSMEDSDDGGYLAGALGSYVSDDARTRGTLVAQVDEHGKLDGDGNGVSEAPLQKNENVIARLSHDLTQRDNLTLRAALTRSDIFGGPMDADNIEQVLAGFDGIESEQLFEDNDVRRGWVGKPWETTEWIETQRTELSGTWLHEFSGDFNTAVSLAYSEHEQDSFYEGFDYAATDELFYGDLRNNLGLGEAHLLTFGVDLRDETMRSESLAGAESDNYIEDSFDYRVVGLYVQDTWMVSDRLELAMALRVDSVEADFVAIEKPGTEISETVFAPRMDMRYFHSDRWTSRLSAGLGYRAPLSFFETDHGILDAGDGFAIDVDDLETSQSVNYALSYEGPALSATLSLAHTRVYDLAALDETEDGVPLLTQLDEPATVAAADLALGYVVNSWLTLGATFEHFAYDETFESSFAIAPVVDRVVLTTDIDVGAWSFFASAVGVGERDLADFGYEGFNVLGSEVGKDTMAEAYWTVDLRLQRDFGDRFSLYAGAVNLFDYTQVREAETPLFWDADGGYDVAYIYGPLRGRELYAGINLRF